MNNPKELCAIAERVVWFESADETLLYPRRFLAYLMTYGTLEEILAAREYFPDPEFQSVLDDPPAGIFDARSWSYWNYAYGHSPVPPLPKRHIPGVDPDSIPDLFPAKSYRPGS